MSQTGPHPTFKRSDEEDEDPACVHSGSTMIQLHLSPSVCPLRSLQSSVFLACSSLSYTGTQASSADSGPNFINYKPICCWQPLWRGLYPALASVQHKHSEGWRDGGRRKQGHLWLPPWVKHGAVQGNGWGGGRGGWWGFKSSCFQQGGCLK